MNINDHAHERYDVAILGAGMAGGMLGAVLARNGVKVLLIDAGTHPRFAVGESTIPYTSAMTRIVAERYQVPEIEHLASFRGVQDKVSPMSGRKQNFGFVYHREGLPQNPQEINQLVVPEWQRTESHLFRQDTDAYLFHLAVRYGATPLLATRITGIETGADGVLLRSQAGAEYRAAYLVDGSGFRSPSPTPSTCVRTPPAPATTPAPCSPTWSASPPTTTPPRRPRTSSPAPGTTAPCTTSSPAAGCG